MLSNFTRIALGRCTAVGLLAALLMLSVASQSDAHAKVVKPSIKVTGISVNDFDAAPNSKITYQPNNPPNACYDIGGAGQDPQSVTVLYFIHAVGIPANAPTTITMVTPWNTLSFPDAQSSDAAFSQNWFRDRPNRVSNIFGGSNAPDNFYKYDDEGTGGNAFNGSYAVTTTVRVHGKTLRAHATLTVNC